MLQPYKWDSYGTSYKGGRRIEIAVVRGANPLPAPSENFITGSFPYPQDPSANVVYAIGDLVNTGNALKAVHDLPTIPQTVPQFKKLIRSVEKQ